jgi:phosphoribosylformylglycinamidine synthase
VQHAVDLGALPDLEPARANTVLLELLASENLASRRWIFRQYDHQVLNNTVVPPGGDAAVIWLKGTTRGVAVATDCNGRLVGLEPRIGAQIAVAEAARNVVAVGATPVAVTDCLNFGNPERSEVAYQLEQSIIGLAEACRALGTPVVSGNASLYNETPDGAVLPTPTVGMLGVLDDVAKALTVAPSVGDTVVLLGATPDQDADTLTGSEYLAHEHAMVAGRPYIDLEFEARAQHLVLAAHARGLLTAAHDCADGGVAVALAECSIASNLGLDASAAALGARLDAALFGEAQSRFVVATRDVEALRALAAQTDVPVTVLGAAGGDRLRLGPIDVAVDALREAYEGGLARILGGADVAGAADTGLHTQP